MVVDLFLVYQFLRRLATPFNEWDAYELGIIAERGNLLKKRRELRTVKEREAFCIFDLMITKIKRLIEKVPGGKSRIASYAAALYLIKEDWEHMTEEEMEASIEEYFNSLDESTDYKFELFAKMLEDAPANGMGGGNIAGGGYNGSGDVKVPPAAASRYKKKNKKDQQKLRHGMRSQNQSYRHHLGSNLCHARPSNDATRNAQSHPVLATTSVITCLS